MLALGAGGIQAAMFAVLGGANEITVLESDPGRADVLRQLPPLSGGRTRVRLVAQDPRTYLQESTVPLRSHLRGCPQGWRRAARWAGRGGRLPAHRRGVLVLPQPPPAGGGAWCSN